MKRKSKANPSASSHYVSEIIFMLSFVFSVFQVASFQGVVSPILYLTDPTHHNVLHFVILAILGGLYRFCRIVLLLWHPNGT